MRGREFQIRTAVLRELATAANILAVGDQVGAVRYLDRLRCATDNLLPDKQAMLFQAISSVLTELGDWSGALRAAEQGLLLLSLSAPEFADHPLQWDLRYLGAQAHLRSGRPGMAVAAARELVAGMNSSGWSPGLLHAAYWASSAILREADGKDEVNDLFAQLAGMEDFVWDWEVHEWLERSEHIRDELLSRDDVERVSAYVALVARTLPRDILGERYWDALHKYVVTADPLSSAGLVGWFCGHDLQFETISEYEYIPLVFRPTQRAFSDHIVDLRETAGLVSIGSR